MAAQKQASSRGRWPPWRGSCSSSRSPRRPWVRSPDLGPGPRAQWYSMRTPRLCPLVPGEHCWAMTRTGVPLLFAEPTSGGVRAPCCSQLHSPGVLAWVRGSAGTRTQGPPALSCPAPAHSCRGQGAAAAGGGRAPGEGREAGAAAGGAGAAAGRAAGRGQPADPLGQHRAGQGEGPRGQHGPPPGGEAGERAPLVGVGACLGKAPAPHTCHIPRFWVDSPPWRICASPEPGPWGEGDPGTGWPRGAGKVRQGSRDGESHLC